jgi:hypothetical protein
MIKNACIIPDFPRSVQGVFRVIVLFLRMPFFHRRLRAQGGIVMKRYQIVLNSINSVKEFVDLTALENCEIDVLSGRYVVDGKSIMALFSIDLNKPVVVCYHGADKDADAFRDKAAKLLTIAEI